MDGTLVVQDGLSEDGPSSVASAHPDALPTPLGSAALPDQWDEGECQSPAPLRTADVLPLSRKTWGGRCLRPLLPQQRGAAALFPLGLL